MSTDLQKYSTEHQLEAIRRYAEQRGYTIVHVFEDSGRSGLRIDGRDGLQSLMLEVQSGTAAFQAILVYDVSRWGRFQDADVRDASSYLLLDGHLRIEVLRDLGQIEVECLISTDDEAFTYNKRVNRLSPVQEQRMIAKAIERNVPRDKIARALDINVRSVSRKVQLLDGICEEVIGLLKDKMCPMAVFDVLRKMNPLRQIEAAELLINANNFSVSYASAILAGTPQAQLVTPQTPKRLKGMTAEAIARMERELSRLQGAISSIQDSYTLPS